MTKDLWKSAIGAWRSAAGDWSDATSSPTPPMTSVDTEASERKSKTEVHWKRAISADFNTAADWSTGTVPGASDDAILNAKGAAFDVTASTSETVKSIQLASNATLDVEARTFTATAGTGSGVNAGLIRIHDNAFFAVGGGVKNTGTIALDSGGSQTAMILDANTTLNGGGQVTLSDNPNNLIEGAAAGDALTNVDNTISGAGQLGAGQMTLINEANGVIDATGTNALVLDTSGELATNAGLIEATGTGGLLLQSTTVANGAKGVIEANGAGSHVDLGTATIEGGTLKTANGGVIQAVDRGSVLDGTVDAVKVAGTVDIVNGTAAYLCLEGTIDNTGTINIQSAGNDVRLRMSANTLLTGTGAVIMSDSNNNTIDAGTPERA